MAEAMPFQKHLCNQLSMWGLVARLHSLPLPVKLIYFGEAAASCRTVEMNVVVARVRVRSRR